MVEDFSAQSLHHFRGSILFPDGFRIWKKNREFQYELWHRDEQIQVQCELMDPSRYVSPSFELRQTVDKSGPAEPPRASLTCHDPAFEHPALVLLCFYLFDLYSSSRPI